MAERTTVTLKYQDSYGKSTSRNYTARSASVSDAAVQALATAAQGLTALSLVKATVTREVDITAQSDAAETKSSRQKDASLTFLKSSLRNSFAGNYTFNLPEPKAALVGINGTIDLDDATVAAWREQFDDGSGIAAVQGLFFVSETEELVEEADPVDGFLNKF